MQGEVSVGQNISVQLPGELMRAEVLGIHEENGDIEAKLLGITMSKEHQYKPEDVVRCRLKPTKLWPRWEPV